MSNFGRRSFWLFNKIFMIPIFLLGFGPFVGNKLTGYIMVLRTLGRKTGKIRYTPVNYAIYKGNAHCVAGWGHFSDWYRNILQTGEVELILPSGPIFGRAEVVTDIDERRIIIRKILQNAGFAGFLEGFNPYKITDEELLNKTSDMPLIRISPTGIGNGPYDPGGLYWIWSAGSILVIIIIIIVLTRLK